MTPTLTQRAIRTVTKTTGTGTVRLSSAEALSDLTGLTGHALRVQSRDTQADQRTEYRCGACNAEVALRFRRNGRSGERTSFFVHALRADAKACSWYAGPDIHDLGAVQFGGQQEGWNHREAKRLLEICLKADDWFSDITLEKTIFGGDEPGRRADVFARFGEQEVSFEVQVARPSLETIVGRQAFYQKRNIDLVWVTSLSATSKLTSAAFTDLVVSNGGSILAVSEAAVEASQAAGELKLHQFRIAPRLGDRGSYCVWKHNMVGLNDILISPADRREANASAFGRAWLEQIGPEAAAAAKTLRENAAQGAGMQEMANAYRKLFRVCVAPGTAIAAEDGLPIMMAWLSALDGLIDNPQQARLPDQLSKRTEALLNAKTGAFWLRRTINLLDLYPEQAKALPDDIMRRLRVLQGSTTRKVEQQYSRLLAAVFPKFANALLARPPKYPPQLVGVTDRVRPLHSAPLA
ncbi:DUF6035 family protein [Devosia marina]|nr:DUF6035 family protein [Devosia marina]